MGSRTHNFSEDEKLYLVELAKMHSVIEAKGYENDVLKKKAEAWDFILESFTARFSGKTDWKQLALSRLNCEECYLDLPPTRPNFTMER